MRPFVVGIAGGSASGKTTVVERLVEALAPITVAVLPHDAYYHDLSHLPTAERAAVNVDHPDSLETELLLEHLGALTRGDGVEVPDYDYVSQTRGAQGRWVVPSQVIVVEGLFPLSDERIRAMSDLKVFVSTTSTERLRRRIGRDRHERGRGAAEVERQHGARVEPMHRRFVEPSARWADVTVTGGGFNDGAITALADRIRGQVG